MIKIAQIIGPVAPPGGVSAYGSGPGGLSLFFSNLVKVLIIGAGLYGLINLVVAGYLFMSAQDDPKKVASAWAMIWQTALGILISAGSFVLAGIFGKLIFNDFNALLQIRVFGPS